MEIKKQIIKDLLFLFRKKAPEKPDAQRKELPVGAKKHDTIILSFRH